MTLNAKTQIVPSKSRLKDALKWALQGAGGGLAVILATALLGIPVGTAGGAVVAGAMMGGTGGRIVATQGVMDAVIASFQGGE